MTDDRGTKSLSERVQHLPDNDPRGVTEGSGDVFADLGIELSPEEEFKYALARMISRMIVAKGYTQKQVATILGADQAKVSQITRGQLAGFSTERLIRYLLTLGIDINVDFLPSQEGRGRLRVAAAG
jgi:predicted XRE-type DNA-binding protein